jgi:hypothetical protein
MGVFLVIYISEYSVALGLGTGTAAMGQKDEETDPKLGEAARTAEYIAELCMDLARMARGDSLDTLAYLLDMARLEAQSVTQQMKLPE